MPESQPTNIFSAAHTCLMCDDVDAKVKITLALYQKWLQKNLNFAPDSLPVLDTPVPGRPAKPVMVSALEVDKRKLSTPDGRSAFVHSLAHIEFNAINLALDAVYRFREMPHDFYGDWLRVAAEEAQHFCMLRDHLRGMGHDYGDFTAHNGLWDMAVSTAHDPLVRMALVPRVLEARGLDVLPGIMHKFTSCGAHETVTILQTIMHDEIGHVAIGNRWYAWLCEQRQVDPLQTFRHLLEEYQVHRFRGPFHIEARMAAGFSKAELEMLEEGIRLAKAPASN